jgi:hypothetical protein
MTKKRETVEVKGWRLFVAGAVRHDDGHGWLVRGDIGEYEVSARSLCNCPAYYRCSHEVAVEYASGVLPAPTATVEVDARRLHELLRAEIVHERLLREESKNLEGLFA